MRCVYLVVTFLYKNLNKKRNLTCTCDVSTRKNNEYEFATCIWCTCYIDQRNLWGKGFKLFGLSKKKNNVLLFPPYCVLLHSVKILKIPDSENIIWTKLLVFSENKIRTKSIWIFCVFLWCQGSLLTVIQPPYKLQCNCRGRMNG